MQLQSERLEIAVSKVPLQGRLSRSLAGNAPSANGNWHSTGGREPNFPSATASIDD